MKTILQGLATSLVILTLLSPFANASESWQSQGPTGSVFHSLAQGPNGTIYAGTVAGLFQYESSREQWSRVPLDRERVGLVFASSGNVLFSQHYSGSCIASYERLVSYDSGETWAEDEGIPYWIGIKAIAETLDRTIWAVTSENELFRRNPGDDCWTQHFSLGSMRGPHDLAATADGRLLVLASVAETGEPAVFLSDDTGSSWSIALRTDARLSALAVNSSGYVVIGAERDWPDGVTFFSSTSSGRDWFERPCRSEACSELNSVRRLTILPNRTVAAAGWSWSSNSGQLIVSDLFMDDWGVAAQYSEVPRTLLADLDRTIWVAGMGYAHRSTDNAASFETATNGIVNTAVTGLAESGENVLALVGSFRIGGFFGLTVVPGSAGVHISRDHGATWSTTSVTQANQIATGLSDAVLAATDLGVQRSHDHGNTWWTVPGTESMAVRAVAEDLFGTLCVIADESVRCGDGVGGPWHDGLNLKRTERALVATSNGVFLAVGFGAVHRSTDGGSTWQATIIDERVWLLAVDHHDAVYALMAESDRIAVSHDSGHTWKFIHAPFPNPRSIAFHPMRGLFVGYYNTVYSSADGGESWRRIDLPASSLLVTGNRLVAGSEYRGVWLADLPSSIRRPSGRVGR